MTGKTEEEMRREVQSLVNALGSQKAVAEKLGLSPGFICDVLKGNRAVGANLARHFGRMPVVIYERFKGMPYGDARMKYLREWFGMGDGGSE